MRNFHYCKMAAKRSASLLCKKSIQLFKGGAFSMNKWRKSVIVLLALVLTFSLAACGSNDAKKGKQTIVFADAGWDSLKFHNSVAQFILENGYGYKTDTMSGSTPASMQGLQTGDMDVLMEVWTDNVIDSYQPALDSGKVVEVGTNFEDNKQGVYVPTYVIKGDKERGIEAMAPDLKTVQDLEKYPELFQDPEDKKKGRIVGAIPGWAVESILTEKIETYGLDKTYNIFRPGSDSALSSSLVSAYEKGEPWVGYYWEPTWIMGKYDMTLLEEPAYNKKEWEDGYKTSFPPVKVTIAMNKETKENNPEVTAFLGKYHTTTDIANEALAYMQKNDASPEEAAQFFLKEQEDVWTKWVSEEVATKVKEKLAK